MHALRARGVRAGDPVATLPPNWAELIQTLLAVFQAGWQYVPLNTHLTAGEVAYILADSGAAALVADARFAEVAGDGRGRAGVPRRGAARRSARSPASSRSPTRSPTSPTRTPDGPRRRAVHAVHVGHDRTAEGGAARPADSSIPRRGWRSSAPTSPATTSSPAATRCTS